MDTQTYKLLLDGSASSLIQILGGATLAFNFFFPTASNFQITVAAICFKYFVYKWFPKILSQRLDFCLWPSSVQRPQQVPGSLWGWALRTQALKYSFCPAELVKCCSWTCRQLVMGERFCPTQNCPRWCWPAVVNLQLGLVKANWPPCLLFVFLFSLFCHGWILVPLLSSALWPSCGISKTLFFSLYTSGLRAAMLPAYVRSFKAHLLPSFQPSRLFLILDSILTDKGLSTEAKITFVRCHRSQERVLWPSKT